MYSPRKAVLTGDTEITANNSALKITWFDCYYLNDRGRMGIGHVLASWALVGRDIIFSDANISLTKAKGMVNIK